LETYGEHCSPPTNGRIYYHNQPVGRSSDQDWYAFSLCYDPHVPANQDWMVKPNFDPRNGAKQYRWPALDWTQLTCSNGKSAATAINPAGMPTMCGTDFDAWFQTIVPPPPGTATVTASADTTLYAAAPNSNDGAGFYLSLGANPPRGNHARVVLGFDAVEIEAALTAGEVSGVFLMLTPEPLLDSDADLLQATEATGVDSISLTAFPLAGDFVEGDGYLAEGDRGIGAGATWYCAVDADTSDNFRNCLQRWPTPLLHRRAGVTVRQPWAQDSSLILDVTSQVEQGISRWIVVLERGIPFADVAGEPQPLYYSREAAEELGDPDLAPQLFIVYSE